MSGLNCYFAEVYDDEYYWESNFFFDVKSGRWVIERIRDGGHYCMYHESEVKFWSHLRTVKPTHIARAEREREY